MRHDSSLQPEFPWCPSRQRVYLAHLYVRAHDRTASNGERSLQTSHQTAQAAVDLCEAYDATFQSGNDQSNRRTLAGITVPAEEEAFPRALGVLAHSKVLAVAASMMPHIPIATLSFIAGAIDLYSPLSR